MKPHSKKKTKAQIKSSSRYLAMKILVDVEQNNSYVNLQLAHVLNQVSLSDEDKGLLTELVYGVTQRQITLDYILKPYVTKKIPVWLRALLRLSIFQLLFLDRIPDYAVVNEASDITHLKGGQGLVNFVNGVLRNVVRYGQVQLNELNELPLTIQSVSLQTSMPVWLVKFLQKQYTLQVTKDIGQSLLEKPKLSIRVVNEAVLSILKEQYNAQDSVISPVAKRLDSGKILSSSLFTQGDVTIQDETSTLVAQVATIKASDNVLDTCAAPGGKTAHIASYVSSERGGKVMALDLHEHKLQLIKENVTRLHVDDRVQMIALDARQVDKQFDHSSFDVVCVDAPCSGLGLMRRKPDIKYSKQTNAIESLSAIQYDILKSANKVLKIGGSLVYSTCTLSYEENQQQVQRFLNEHPNYQIEPLTWMALPKDCYTDEGFIEVLPHLYQTDGFFIAKLNKLA